VKIRDIRPFLVLAASLAKHLIRAVGALKHIAPLLSSRQVRPTARFSPWPASLPGRLNPRLLACPDDSTWIGEDSIAREDRGAGGSLRDEVARCGVRPPICGAGKRNRGQSTAPQKSALILRDFRAALVTVPPFLDSFFRVRLCLALRSEGALGGPTTEPQGAPGGEAALCRLGKRTYPPRASHEQEGAARRRAVAGA